MRKGHSWVFKDSFNDTCVPVWTNPSEVALHLHVSEIVEEKMYSADLHIVYTKHSLQEIDNCEHQIFLGLFTGWFGIKEGLYYWIYCNIN